MTQRTGFVYLICHGDLHKIGVSARPEVRLSEVGAPDGCVAHLIASGRPYGVEAALHRAFDAQRVKSEWFRLSPQDVALLRSLSLVESPDDLPDALLIRRAPSVQLRVMLPAGPARALARVAACLGMSEDELLLGILNAHLREYELLALECERRRAG